MSIIKWIDIDTYKIFIQISKLGVKTILLIFGLDRNQLEFDWFFELQGLDQIIQSLFRIILLEKITS